MMRVIEATLMDRRWQLVLDCLDAEQAPFSKGTLVAFRKRLIEQTIEIASQSQELHIDRAYLSSHLVQERSDDLEVYCKA
jgi:hypothetical protein